MIKIESKDNAIFKDAKKLKTKKERKARGSFLVEGFRFLSEAFYEGCKVEAIFIVEKEIHKLHEYINKDKLVNTKVYGISENLLSELSDTETPQGVVGIVSINNIKNVNNTDNFYVLCDMVQDPGNLGTIIRTSHAAGASGVILTKGTVDPYNSKTLRATMGSIFHIPIIEDNELDFIKELKEKGYSILAASLEGENNFFEEDLTNNLVICVGNEGNGLSDYIYSLSDIKVKIPMPGNAESLNVSTAAGIMIYERVRQKSLINNKIS